MSAVADIEIAREIVIDAPIEVVWRTITEPDQIARWFADRVELDALPGAHGVLTFDKNNVTAPVVVERVEAPTLFSFRWGHPDGGRPVHGNSTLVEFSLIAETDTRTRLRVAETGLDAVAWPEDEKERYADSHGEGWERCFDRLAALFTDDR